MGSKMLLMLTALTGSTFCFAQKEAGSYAITPIKQGGRTWTEVRWINLGTGESREVFQSKSAFTRLNARTGTAISEPEKKTTPTPVRTSIQTENGKRVVYVQSNPPDELQPFATGSAACAFDKKHQRLYYTPSGINQLRYIDLKSGEQKVYYFENEKLGALTGRHDIPNQITRMVIGDDGNGYALTNNSNHLIRFTTDRKASITDLGGLQDDPANGKNTVKSGSVHGGDMVAGNKGSLYLIGANRTVWSIRTKDMTAVYMGEITGLPKGFSTNGAVVLDDTHIAVASSGSTEGYYSVDMKTLKAEKISTAGSVYNASDLANHLLLNEKKIRQSTVKEQEAPQVPLVEQSRTVVITKPVATPDAAKEVKSSVFSVYPNPVTGRNVKLLFKDPAPGVYSLQLIDINGKMIEQKRITVANKNTVQEISLPGTISSGTYFLRLMNRSKEIVATEKLVVE